MAVTLNSSQELEFADNIAEHCYRKYIGLSKTGKPDTSNEWTLLSAVVKVDGIVNADVLRFEVVALGTGSKCIGGNEMSSDGDVLNDSHAEVMARRGFLRYLYHQVELTYKTGVSDVFQTVIDGKCVLKSDVSFHFFTSHTPCGDGSIFQKTLDFDDFGKCLQSNGANTNRCSKSETEFLQTNIVRSGAKFKSSIPIENIQQTNSFTNAEMKSENSLQSDNIKSNIGLKVKENILQSAQLYVDESDLFDKTTSRLGIIENGQNKCLDDSKDHVVVGDEISPSTGTKRRSETESTPSKRIATCLDEQVPMRSLDVEQSEDRVDRLAEKSDGVLLDVHRTGAKCVTSETQDKRESGIEYHVVGVLRTKPGRGDPTLSLSCSDKLARWHAVGSQGALLSILVAAPVCFQSLIVGGGCPFSRDALRRAVVLRSRSLDDPRPLLIVQSSSAFVDGRTRDGNKRPCASSIVWCNVPDRPLEVAVKGRKQGVTKKMLKTSAGRLLICRKELASRFVDVVSLSPNAAQLVSGLTGGEEVADLKAKTYKCLKHLARDYQHAWQQIRTSCFPAWPDKPEFLNNFTINR